MHIQLQEFQVLLPPRAWDTQTHRLTEVYLIKNNASFKKIYYFVCIRFFAYRYVWWPRQEGVERLVDEVRDGYEPSRGHWELYLESARAANALNWYANSLTPTDDSHCLPCKLPRICFPPSKPFSVTASFIFTQQYILHRNHIPYMYLWPTQGCVHMYPLSRLSVYVWTSYISLIFWVSIQSDEFCGVITCLCAVVPFSLLTSALSQMFPFK